MNKSSGMTQEYVLATLSVVAVLAVAFGLIRVLGVA